MSYIGKVDVGSDRYAVGSTLYGICGQDVAAATAAKVVTLDDFTTLIRGVTVFVKFVNGNTATSNVTLEVGSTSALSVVGNCTCNANDVLAFTYEENASSPGNCWRVHSCGDMVSHSELTTAINNIPRGTVFKGTVQNLPDSSTSYTNYGNGDIIIVGSKEYIYQRGDSAANSSWHELGDESAYALESNATTITTVGTWTGASVTNGVLVIPSLTTSSTNVIAPRS